MWKAIVMRAARPWGSRLVERLLEAGVEVLAHSRSERKLERLKERFNSPSRLHTISGPVGNLKELLAVAQGARVIFYDAYLTYDDKPKKVQHQLEDISVLAAAIGAKRVIVEGVYAPGEEWVSSMGIDANLLRILSPELYGSEVSNTFVYYAFKRLVRGKSIKQLFDPSVRQEYTFLEDASRDALELALSSTVYGRTWKLRTNGPISLAELLAAACPDVELSRFERVARWKIGLLLLVEPKIGQLMENYRIEHRGAAVSAINYVGGELTSYEKGAAITIERMMEKLDNNEEIKSFVY